MALPGGWYAEQMEAANREVAPLSAYAISRTDIAYGRSVLRPCTAIPRTDIASMSRPYAMLCPASHAGPASLCASLHPCTPTPVRSRILTKQRVPLLPPSSLLSPVAWLSPYPLP
eukprot:429909-Rhodomonas_salina.2